MNTHKAIVTHFVEELLHTNTVLHALVQKLHTAGAHIYVVGGAVRDLFLQLPVKDLDIEVHHISLAVLEEILRSAGPVHQVGKAYGVLRVDRLDVDWSLPRTETAGRKPTVFLDPDLSVKKAFERRDLTINAMGIDLIYKELIDPYGGLADLHKGILRATSAARFSEDPLRFFRVFQFIARFGMWPDDELNTICKHMDVSSVSVERIEMEYKKWLLKSSQPSRSLEWLASIDRLADIMPEIAATQGVEQSPEWHPEGDVFEHSKQAVDAAAQMQYESEEQQLIIMYAALCHDLGKAVTTKKEEGKITSYGHAEIGAKITKTFLRRITSNSKLIWAVSLLVEVHMRPLALLEPHVKPSAYRRLALKIEPLPLSWLALLAQADRLARNPLKGSPLHGPVPDVELFLRRAQEANVVNGLEKPVVHGRDLMPEIEPGPLMGKLLKKAYQIQLDEGIKDKEKLKKRILKKR